MDCPNPNPNPNPDPDPNPNTDPKPNPIPNPNPNPPNQVERQYVVRHAARHARGGPNFPAEYPPSALLGCVRLRDCLAHEEYAAAHPDGEENGCAGLLMLGLGLGSTLTLTLTLNLALVLTLNLTLTSILNLTLPRSAYLFMCDRPRWLRLPVRVSGQHKIWLA